MITPESILPDGVDETVVTNPFNGKQCKARKGTVATTILNIARLNKLLDIDLLSVEESDEIQGICQTQKRLNLSLSAVAIFDLFSIDEWLNTDKMPGRVYIAMLFLEDNPLQVSTEIGFVAQFPPRLVSA